MSDSPDVKHFVFLNERIRDNAIKYIRVLPLDGRWQVTIEPYHEEYTDEQVRLFWVWCRYIARLMREAGKPCSETEIHDLVCMEIFGVSRSHLDPRLTRPARTITKPRKASKRLMTEILDRFRVWAGEELCIQLPDPINPGDRRNQTEAA